MMNKLMLSWEKNTAPSFLIKKSDLLSHRSARMVQLSRCVVLVAEGETVTAAAIPYCLFLVRMPGGLGNDDKKDEVSLILIYYLFLLAAAAAVLHHRQNLQSLVPDNDFVVFLIEGGAGIGVTLRFAILRDNIANLIEFLRSVVGHADNQVVG